MMTLEQWQILWGIPDAAIADLVSMGIAAEPRAATRGDDEAYVSACIRLNAPKSGARLWRNNVGAGVLDNGSFIRWGLANDSKQLNAAIKSGDLIGILPVRIKPQHVGRVIGQFVSVEAKRLDWKPPTQLSRDAHVIAQTSWAALVRGLGGLATITNDPNLTIRTSID